MCPVEVVLAILFWCLYRGMWLPSIAATTLGILLFSEKPSIFLPIFALVEGNFMKSSWRWQITSTNSWHHLNTVGFASPIISRMSDTTHQLPSATNSQLLASRLEERHAFWCFVALLLALQAYR